MKLSRFSHYLYACGNEGPPVTIEYEDRIYQLEKIFKHDFWAATALYVFDGDMSESNSCPAKIVLKINRTQHFFYIPLIAIGWVLYHHEYSTLKRLAGIKNVPQLLGTFGKCAFMYEFIEGKSLNDKPDLPEGFFERLHETINQVHQRGIIYFDMNKRGNILLGRDSLPYLIDFQISMYMGDRFLLFKRLTRKVRQGLQSYDIYHIFKHKRKMQPELLTPEQEALSLNKTGLLKVHRAIAEPYRKIRRAVLRWLHDKGAISRNDNTEYNAETDPDRWAKK